MDTYYPTPSEMAARGRMSGEEELKRRIIAQGGVPGFTPDTQGQAIPAPSEPLSRGNQGPGAYVEPTRADPNQPVDERAHRGNQGPGTYVQPVQEARPTPPAAEEEPQSYLKRVGWGLASWAGDRLSGVADLAGDALDSVEGDWTSLKDTPLDDVVNGKIVFGDMADNGIVGFKSAAEMRDARAKTPENVKGVGLAVHNIADMFDDIGSESYRPQFSDFERAVSEISEGKPMYMLGWIAENAPNVAADVVAAIAAPTVSVAALTGMYAKDRAANDGRTETTAEDYAYAAPSAVLSMYLDKVTGKGLSAVLGKKGAEKLANIGGQGMLARTIRGTVRGALSEGISGAQEEIAASYDTKKGVVPRDVMLNALAEAIMGSTVGGAVDLVTGGGPGNIEPKVKGKGGKGNEPAEDIAAAADAAGPTPPPKQPLALPPPAAVTPPPSQYEAAGINPQNPDAPLVQPEAPVEGKVTLTPATDYGIPTEGVTPGVTPATPRQVVPRPADMEDTTPAAPDGLFGGVDQEIAAEKELQRALAETPNVEDTLRKSEQASADLAKNSAAMQLANSIVNPDKAIPMEGDTNPRDALSDMFDKLSTLARAEIPSIPERVDARLKKTGDIAKMDLTAVDNMKQRMQDKLADVAAKFGQLRTAVRDIASSGSPTTQRRALAGLIPSSEQLMRDVGIDTKPLIAAARGGDIGALISAMGAITAEAEQRSKGRDIGQLPEPARDKPFTGGMDEAWGRARVPTFEASDLLYDEKGRRRKDLTEEEIARIEENIEAEKRAKDVAKYGVNAYDYNMDSDVENDPERELAARRKLAGEKQERKSREADDVDQLLGAKSEGEKLREAENAKRREDAGDAPKFSENVMEAGAAYVHENQLYGPSEDEMQAGELLQDALDNPETRAGAAKMLRAIERRMQAASKEKVAGKKSTKANARATGLPFVAKTTPKRRDVAMSWKNGILSGNNRGNAQDATGLDTLRGALNMARRMAENAMTLRGADDYYRGEYVLVPGKTRADDKLAFVAGVRPKLRNTGDWKNPQRFAPIKRTEKWQHAFYTADQLEVGPTHATHVIKEELTGRVRAASAPLKQHQRYVSPAHYDDVLRFVANNIPYNDPLALTDALLMSAMKATKGRSGTAGYQGVKNGPKHGQIVMSQGGGGSTTAGNTVDPAMVDDIVDNIDDAPVDEQPQDMTVEQLVELIKNSGLVVSPEDQVVVEQLSADLKRARELEERLLQVDVDDIRAQVEAQEVQEPDAGMLFVNEDAVAVKDVDTPLGWVYAVKVGGNRYFDSNDTEKTTVRNEASVDEALTEAVMDAVNAKIELTQRELANLRKDIRDAQKSIKAFPRKGNGAGGTGGKVSIDTNIPDGAPVATWSMGGGPVTGHTTATPVHLGGVVRKRAPKRAVADLYQGITRSEPLDPGVDLSEFAPGVERPGLKQLYDYQVEGVASILHTWKARLGVIASRGKDNLARAGFALFDKPGSGKSAQVAISAAKIAEDERASGRNRKILIVVPNQSLQGGKSIKDTDYAKNIIHDGQQFGVDVTTDQFEYIQYTDLSAAPAAVAARFKDEYAAIFFDEAHAIKNLGGRNLGPNAAALKTDFRVFVTATPTDMAGQELYYLSYMLGETNPEASSLEQARRFVTSQLRLDFDGKKASTRFTEADYIRTITEQFLDPAIARHQSVSRAMPSITDNNVEVIQEELLDREAMAMYAKATNDAQRELMLEHIKVPALVEATIATLKGEVGAQVVVVFKSNMDTSTAKNLGKFTKSPLVRFREELAARLEEVGLDRSHIAIYSGPKNIDGSAIRDFQIGTARVLVMTDTAGSTGINLDDNPAGSRDKYYNHLPAAERPAVESRPRAMFIGGVSLMGERLTQLLGRIDRANTQTIPKVVYFAVDGNPTEQRNRQKLREKVSLQDAVTGITRARSQGLLEDTSPTLMDAEADGKKLFKASDHEALQPSNQSPIDRDLAKHVGEGTTANSALDWAASQPINPATKLFIKFLRSIPALGELKVRMIPRDAAADADHMGYYDPAYDPNTIWLHPDTSYMVDTLIHEAVHYLTSYDIFNDPAVAARLQRIMDSIPTHIQSQFEYAFTNPAEFVAEVFSNDMLRDKLLTTKARGDRTFWQRIKDFVWSVLRSHGVTSQRSVFDQVMDMDLLLSGNAGRSFSPSSSANVMADNSLFSRRATMKPVAPREARKSLFAKLGSFIDGIGGKGTSESAFAVAEKAMLATLTLEQITDTYGPMSKVMVAGKGERNLLKNVLTVFEKRFAKAQKLASQYTEKVMDKWRGYAQNEGRRMIKVRMAAGKKPVTMTELEYLSNLMVLSGIGQAHFGRDINDQANTVVAAQMRVDATGKRVNNPGEQAAIWKLHKEQFNRLSPKAKQTYNELADFFSAQHDRKSVLLAGMWLDVNFPLENGETWTNRNDKEVRNKVKKTAAMTDDELEQLAVGRDSLKEVQAMLKPGRVPGAYFPLQRFGKYVVTTEAEWDVLSEKEADGFLGRHPGARYDAKKNVVTLKEVARFESLVEAETYVAQMRGAGKDYEVSEPMLADDEMVFERAKISSAMFEQFRKKLDRLDVTKESRELLMKQFSQVALEMSPVTNIGSTLMPRNRVLGASTDIARVLANYGAGNAHYMAGIEFSKQMSDAKRELSYFVRQEMAAQPHFKPGLRDRAKDGRRLARVVQELNKREAAVADPFEMGKSFQAMNDVGFLYYLTGVSYNVVNMTQVPLYTIPFLSGRYGIGKASAAVARAYKEVGGAPIAKLVKTGGTVSELRALFTKKGTAHDFDKANYRILDDVKAGLSDKKHHDLLEYMAEMGDIEATLAMDFQRTSERSHVDANGHPRPQTKWEYLTEWMKMAPHIVEVMNRSVTAIAAFDLQYAREKASGKTDKQAYEAAAEYARTAIKRSQFIYAPWNRARIMQGQQLRTIMMFKQHVQNTYYNLISNFVKSSRGLSKRLRGEKMNAAELQDYKEASRALRNFLGFMLLANGAVGGVPEPMKWMIQLVNWATGDDDEPFDWELRVQQEMADWFGPELGKVFSKGLPTVAGLDMSSRTGINSMLLFDRNSGDSRDGWVANIARTIGGPMFSLGERFLYDVPTLLKDGQVERATEAATPKAVRDILRTMRLSDEGFTDYKGKVYASSDQLNWGEYAAMYLGFTPESVSEIYTQRSVLNIDRAMMSKRSDFYDRYFRAESADERAKIRADISAWNRKNPTYRITYDQLRRSMKERRRQEAETQNSIYVPKARRAHLMEQMNFMTD